MSAPRVEHRNRDVERARRADRTERTLIDTEIHRRLRVLGHSERMHRRRWQWRQGPRHHSRAGCRLGSPLPGRLYGAPSATRRMLLVSSRGTGRNDPLAAQNHRRSTDLRCERVEGGVMVEVKFPGRLSTNRPRGAALRQLATERFPRDAQFGGQAERQLMGEAQDAILE